MARVIRRTKLEGYVDQIGELRVHQQENVIRFLLRSSILKQIAEGVDPSCFLKEDGDEFQDQKGYFGVVVTVRGDDAVGIKRVLRTGACVVVQGELEQETYLNEKSERPGPVRNPFSMEADSVSLPIHSIESADLIDDKNAIDQPHGGMTEWCQWRSQ